MTNKYEDLIEDLERFNLHSESRNTTIAGFSYIQGDRIVQALRECGEDKFDVLEHTCISQYVYTSPEDNPNFQIDLIKEYTKNGREVCVQIWLKKKPLPMPEDEKVYWVTYKGHVQDTPYKWLNGTFTYPDGVGGYCDVNGPIFKPLRNPDDSLCECVKPDVKGE